MLFDGSICKFNRVIFFLMVVISMVSPEILQLIVFQMGLLTHDKTSKSSSVWWSKETKKQNKETLSND